MMETLAARLLLTGLLLSFPALVSLVSAYRWVRALGGVLMAASVGCFFAAVWVPWR